jgi:hypothetical protein
MKILTERLTFDQAGMVVEAMLPEDDEGASKSLYMKGIFIQGGVRNFNERVYPVKEIGKAVTRITELIRNGESVCGECDHPEELTINLERVSHLITEMWMEGNNGMGKLKIIPTPMGQLIRTLIEAGVKLGVSSRGVGNVDDRGEVSGFEIITVDVVARPSAPDAYPKPVYESLNTKRGRIIEDLANAAVTDPMAMRFLKKELLNVIGDLQWKI